MRTGEGRLPTRQGRRVREDHRIEHSVLNRVQAPIAFPFFDAIVFPPYLTAQPGRFKRVVQEFGQVLAPA